MRLLAIDPGATTGWVTYNTVLRQSGATGQFPADQMPIEALQECYASDVIVIERTVAHGPTRPQVVECAWVGGVITGTLRGRTLPVHEMTRREIKLILTEATNRDIVVKNDATAWAALLLLHGGELAAKKGGRLHGVKSHGRAALAAAVAWHLMRTQVIADAQPSPTKMILSNSPLPLLSTLGGGS